MKRGVTGHYDSTVVGGERVDAFVPDPLPPRPPLAWLDRYLAILNEGTEA